MEAALEALLAKPAVWADGAYGTALRAYVPDGQAVECLNRTQPDRVRALADEYVVAGAAVLWSNTFGAALPTFSMPEQRVEIVRAGVRIAQLAAGGRPVFAALGPTPDVPLLRELALHALEAGAVAVVLETQTSATDAAHAVAVLSKAAVPVFATFTVRRDGHGAINTHCGTPLQEAGRAVVVAGALGTGVNCCDGPATVLAGIQALRATLSAPLIARPNTGVPTPRTAAEFRVALRELHTAGAWLVGGCCGSTPEHLQRE